MFKQQTDHRVMTVDDSHHQCRTNKITAVKLQTQKNYSKQSDCEFKAQLNTEGQLQRS